MGRKNPARLDRGSAARPSQIGQSHLNRAWERGRPARRKEEENLPEVDPRYVALWNLGFRAVPDLIQHLDDPRLTRYIIPMMGNAPSRHPRISDVVADLLIGLSGGKSGFGEWQGPGRGYALARADVRRWWATAAAVGEEAYLVAHALEPLRRPGQIPDPDGHFFPNAHTSPAIQRTRAPGPRWSSWRVARMCSSGCFEGPVAGFTFPRLPVRNLAAMNMADGLGVYARPDETWIEKEWSELRRRVRGAYDRQARHRLL